MRKIFLGIILILILSGCSTEYNLEFKNGKFKDNIKIGTFELKDFPDYEYFEPIASYKNYNIKYYDYNYDNKYLKMNHEYTYDEYRVSSAMIECFELSSISYDNEYYYILTTGEFKCMNYLGYGNEKVKINFKTDLEIESANADTVVGDIYTWIFNKDNYRDKDISIKIKKANQEKNKKEKLSNNYTIAYFLIIIPLLILFYIAYRKFKKYSDSKNKIPD